MFLRSLLILLQAIFVVFAQTDPRIKCVFVEGDSKMIDPSLEHNITPIFLG